MRFYCFNFVIAHIKYKLNRNDKKRVLNKNKIENISSFDEEIINIDNSISRIKNNKILFDSSHISPFFNHNIYFEQLNLFEFNQNTYQNLHLLKKNILTITNTNNHNIFNSKSKCLSKHKKRNIIIEVYKINSNDCLNFYMFKNLNDKFNTEFLILKYYKCIHYGYDNNLEYYIQREAFFQLLAYEKSNINVAKIYFWDYDQSIMSGYILMEYINNDEYQEIGDLNITSELKTKLNNYLYHINNNFLKLGFFHNDLINKGNILVKREKDINFLNSYVIDFEMANTIEYRPFKRYF